MYVMLEVKECCIATRTSSLRWHEAWCLQEWQCYVFSEVFPFFSRCSSVLQLDL